MHKKIIKFLVLPLLVSACSIIPEQVRTDNESSLITYAEAKKSLGMHLNKNARWGGVIANIENKKEFTVLEVVNFNLHSSSKPIGGNDSAGRFKVYYKGLLDPVIYKKGKKITALGIIGTPEKSLIGELEYEFPVLMTSGVYLWDDVERLNVRVKSDPFMNHHYDPFYRSSFYHQPRTIIIKQPKNVKKSKSK